MYFSKKYILVKLKGGFGNQLFQYAIGYALSRKNKASLILDTFSYLEFDSLRNYELHNLNIPNKIIKTKFQKKILFKLSSLFNLNSNIFYNESIDFFYDPEINELSGNIILDGYFQNEKYFIEIKDHLQNLFSVASLKYASNPLYNKIQATQSIAIHIRRGDYVQNQTTNEIHGTCDLSYFEQAQELFNDTDPTYFIFTDDIKWAKENLKINHKHYFINDYIQNDFNEFILMMHCKHYIISNSTFSWWAAWLALHENKKIICPKKWFNDTVLNERANNLIPKSWTRI